MEELSFVERLELWQLIRRLHPAPFVFMLIGAYVSEKYPFGDYYENPAFRWN